MKATTIDQTESDLLKALSEIELDVNDRILSILNEMDRENGRFVLTARNRRLLAKIAVDIDQATAVQLKSPLKDYLRSFDKIDDINQGIFGIVVQGGASAAKQAATVAQQTIVQSLSDYLTDYKNISREINQPIKQLLVRNVSSGVTYAEAEGSLRRFITSTIPTVGAEEAATLGRTSRWATQITRDALNQYDGTVKGTIQKELGLDSFRYVGSIVETTRQNCRHMVTRSEQVVEPVGSGKKKRMQTVANKFADLRQDDGGFRVADIPEIIARSKGSSGWNPDTTPENYFTLRGGYNCRHEAIPYIYSSRRKKALDEV